MSHADVLPPSELMAKPVLYWPEFWQGLLNLPETTAEEIARGTIPNPSAWCAKWRELSARYRAATNGADLATFWDEWRQLMRPFKRPTHYRPADYIHRRAGGMLSE